MPFCPQGEGCTHTRPLSPLLTIQGLLVDMLKPVQHGPHHTGTPRHALIATACKRSLRKGYVFTRVCHSVHRGVWQTPPRQTYIPWADTPWTDIPLGRHPPLSADIPPLGRHPPDRHPTPGRHPLCPVHAGIWSTS